jgi:hypothetical protein
MRDRQLDISQQQTDQTGLYQAGQLQQAANRLGLDLSELEIRAKNEAARLQLDWTKLNQTDRQFLITAQLRAAEEAGRNDRHSTVSGSTAYASDSATLRQQQAQQFQQDTQGSELGRIVVSTPEVKPVAPGWFSSGTPGKPSQRTEIDIRALPATKDRLIPGAVYATAQGNARWNGSAFEAIE